MKAMVSPSRQQQVSPLSPRSPTRSLGAIRAWLLCSTCSEAYAKADKKAGKSKKRKKRDNDSSDSSNCNYETGYGNMGFSVDKHLKTDKLSGTVYLSTEPRLIKAINTATSENKRADEIASKTAKTGKLTAVVTVMSIYYKKMQFAER
jgi:hypothetical protein